MQLILEDAEKQDQSIQCRNCNWQGTANDLTKGDFFVLTNITELFCPRCSKYIGFIQHKNQNEKNSAPGI